MRIFCYLPICIYIKADLLHCHLKTGVYFCFNMQTSLYCWDHIPSCQLTIITCSFTGACPDFHSNLPILNVGCVKQSISQLWVKDDVVSYRASGITTTTKLPAAIWLHLGTQTCNTNSNCWSDWVGEALQIREHCCILACVVQTQCGGIWQEKGFFPSLTIFKCLLLFVLRSRRFWLPWCQRTRSSRKCPAGTKAFGNLKSYSCKKSVHL